MPAGGIVYHSSTWTLSADCAQTERILLHSQMRRNADQKVVINGKGYTISAPNNAEFLNCSGSTDSSTERIVLEINNVTIDGGGTSSRGSLWVQNCEVTLNNVTFTNTYASAIMGGTGAGSGNRGDFTLNNVLFENLYGFYSYHGSRPSAINARLSTTWTLNNVVIRDVFGGSFAIGPAWASDEDKQTGSAPTFTFTGCYTAERIFARERHSSVNPGSRAKCTGMIGNGGQAVKTVPHPEPGDCGLPSGGMLQRNASYSLSGDCTLSSAIYIPAGLTVTIEGNGRSITPADRWTAIANAGNLSIRNAIIQNATHYPMLGYYTGSLVVENTVFRNNSRPVYLKDPTASFTNVLFENNSVASDWPRAHSLYVAVETELTLRKATFRNNSNGTSAIYLAWKSLDGVKPKVTLEDCASFENNSPATETYILNGNGTVVDNTSGATCPAYVYPTAVDLSPQPTPAPAETAQPMEELRVGGGETGVIFRSREATQTQLQVYDVDEATSQGSLALNVTQAQVDAMPGPGVVVTSADCRATVFLNADGTITVKVGPNSNGYFQHTVFDQALHGHIISTYSNFEPIACAALSGCQVTTQVALNLRQEPGGTIIGVVPANATLTAVAKKDGWYNVDYAGRRGWISGDYATPIGNCG